MKYELSSKYDFFNSGITSIEAKIKSVKYGPLIKKTVYVNFDNGLVQTYYLDEDSKILFSYAPDTNKKEAVGITEEIKKNEIEYTGYGYHGGGRKSKGDEARRTTVSICGSAEEIEKIKKLASENGKSVSRYVIDIVL